MTLDDPFFPFFSKRGPRPPFQSRTPAKTSSFPLPLLQKNTSFLCPPFLFFSPVPPEFRDTRLSPLEERLRSYESYPHSFPVQILRLGFAFLSLFFSPRTTDFLAAARLSGRAFSQVSQKMHFLFPQIFPGEALPCNCAPIDFTPLAL